MGAIRVRGHVSAGHWVGPHFRQVTGSREFFAHGGSYGPVKALRQYPATGKVQVLGGRQPDRWYKPTRASRVRVNRLFGAR